MNERLRAWISMALFVVLAGYVGFSALRLGLLLWQRFGAGWKFSSAFLSPPWIAWRCRRGLKLWAIR